MREFIVLFKHELKMMFPILSYNKKKKYDLFGIVLSLLLTIAVATMVVMLVSKIAVGYVDVKIDKIINPTKRATELLNILYVILMALMVVGCVRKMNSTLTNKKNKEIYLRLPVKEQNLFLSKLLALLIWNFIAGLILILPINIIFYIALRPSFAFWIKTIFTLVTMPIVVFGISTLLVVPIIKLVDFLKGKYLLIFALVSGILIGAFVLYSNFLEIVQLWLETGSIKFLFNNNFVSALQSWLRWAYPANCFANFMIGKSKLVSSIIIVLAVALSVVMAIFISNKLFNLTLYKRKRDVKVKKAKNKFKQTGPIVSLMKKEFICVYRNPKHLFSYFAIAIAMPVMVYCCYTLFASLVINAFGLKITFSLALLVVLMFSILTNTFCATNVTRDGISFLKMKSLAIKPSHLLLAKVLFCSIVSSLSILASAIVLVICTDMSILYGLLCVLIAIPFSYAQILIATRLDLNNVKFSSNTAETEASSSKTVVKGVFLGLVLAFVMGIVSMVIYILSQGSTLAIVQKLNLKEIYTYIWPALICVLYLVYAIVYYNYKIEKSFDKLVG